MFIIGTVLALVVFLHIAKLLMRFNPDFFKEKFKKKGGKDGKNNS